MPTRFVAVLICFFTGASAGAATYMDTVLADAPEIYLPLNEAPGATTAVNLGSLGAAGDFTHVDGPLVGQPGILGYSNNRAVRITGGSDTVFPRIENSSLTLTSLGEFSLEFWFQTPDPTAAGGLFSFAVGPSEAQQNELLLFNYDNLHPAIKNQGVTTGPDLTDGDPHHLVVTWRSSDGALNVYLDGSLINGITHQAGVTLVSSGVAVYGQEQDATGFEPAQQGNGYYDELAIYTTALSAERVQAHYNAGIDTIVPEPTSILLTILTGGFLLIRRRH